MSSDYQRNYYMNVLRQRLVYDKDNYELTVSPVTTSYHNIHLNFKGRYTGMDIKLILIDQGNKRYLAFGEPANIQNVDRVFNVGVDGELDKQIVDKIEMISNQLKFVNYFLFGDRKSSTSNNYNPVEFKIKNPQDLLNFSKVLKPFMPDNCLTSTIIVKFILSDDFTSFDVQFAVNSRIDGNLYTGTAEEVINHLLVAYACEPLNKRLDELRLRDHVLLEMVKI